MEVTYVLSNTCLSVWGNDFYFAFCPASRSCVSQHRPDRDPDSVMKFIYSVISLSTSQRAKLYQLQRSMLQSLGEGVFNATADGTKWYSDHRAVKCEISVRVLRWSFCTCQEFPDFHYLIMCVYFNFLSYLYCIPVFVL